MKLVIWSTMSGGPWGGSEDLWTRVAQRGLEQGHQVAASIVRWRPPAPRVAELAASGMILLERRTAPSHRIESLMLRKLKRFGEIRRFRPDVVLFSLAETSEMGSLLGLDAVRRITNDFQIPYVMLSQSGEENNVVPGTGDNDEARVLALHAAEMLFVSKRNLEVFRRMQCLELTNGHVVRNPVNLPDATALPWPTVGRDAPARLCNVGRLNTRSKGHDLLLEVLASERWLKRNWTLTLVGSGPHEGYLRRYVAFRGLSERVIFAGSTNDIRAVWAGQELLVMPSRVEGTPLALVEAMLCGRTAVVTDVGGNCEWITDSQNGFVAAAPTVSSVADALERAWQARPSWPQLGEAARQTALEQYDPDAGQTLLNRLIAVHQRSAPR